MNTSRPLAGPAIFLLAIVLAGGTTCAQQRTASPQPKVDAAGFREFTERMQEYVRLHKKLEATLPPLKGKEAEPAVIAAHQQALAQKIREARPNAKAHDIFTPASQPAFRSAMQSAFSGPQGSHVRATLAEGAPLFRLRLNVNEVYPDGTPQTTVPPTLLQMLPKLPDEVEYRIVGRDLILLDVRANLVVDVLRDILP